MNAERPYLRAEVGGGVFSLCRLSSEDIVADNHLSPNRNRGYSCCYPFLGNIGCSCRLSSHEFPQSIANIALQLLTFLGGVYLGGSDFDILASILRLLLVDEPIYTICLCRYSGCESENLHFTVRLSPVV